MVGMMIDQGIDMRIGLIRVRADNMHAGPGVPKVTVYTVADKQSPGIVPIVPPRIGRSMGECFEDLRRRMITPHPAAQGHPLGGGRARRTNLPRTRRAAPAVQPTIRSPTKAIGKIVVVLRRNRESVQ